MFTQQCTNTHTHQLIQWTLERQCPPCSPPGTRRSQSHPQLLMRWWTLRPQWFHHYWCWWSEFESCWWSWCPPRYHWVSGRGDPMALQVRVSASPAVSIGLLFTESSGNSRMVGVTAEYVHDRKAGIVCAGERGSMCTSIRAEQHLYIWVHTCGVQNKH